MVVTVSLVRMMEVALHKIIRVTAVGDSLVPATPAVGMFSVMCSARVGWSTSDRIRATLFEHMFIDVTAVGAMKVSVVQVVDMPFMFDCGVPAACTMRM
jgi:hypothetical protein